MCTRPKTLRRRASSVCRRQRGGLYGFAVRTATRRQREVEVAPHEAAGRRLAADVVAPLPHPPFPAAIKDGYAVRAADALARAQGVGEARPCTVPCTVDVAIECVFGSAAHASSAVAGAAAGAATGDAALAVASTPAEGDCVPPGDLRAAIVIGARIDRPAMTWRVERARRPPMLGEA